MGVVADRAYGAWSLGWWALYSWRIRRVNAIYRQYQAFADREFKDESIYPLLLRRTSEFQRLVKDAGVRDVTIPHVELAGYGYVSKGNASLMENWLANREDASHWTFRATQIALGYYSDLRWQSLNPLHWLFMLVTLPQQVIKWVGGPADSTLGRFLSAAWTVLLGVVAITGFTLRDVLFPD